MIKSTVISVLLTSVIVQSQPQNHSYPGNKKGQSARAVNLCIVYHMLSKTQVSKVYLHGLLKSSNNQVTSCEEIKNILSIFFGHH